MATQEVAIHTTTSYGEAKALPEAKPLNIEATCTKAFEPNGVPNEVAKAAAGPLVKTLDRDEDTVVNEVAEADPSPMDPTCV